MLVFLNKALACLILSIASFLNVLYGQSSLEGQVKPYKARPTIHINNEPLAPILYALSDVPGGRYSWEELPQHNIKQFCEVGIRLFQLDISFEQLWHQEDTLDIGLAQRQIQGVLDVCPDAAIFFRLHLNPPRWWLDQHPFEGVVYDEVMAVKDPVNGLFRSMESDARRPFRASMASQKWKSAMQENIAQFCHTLAQSPEGNAVVGIQLAYGIYGEWHQWGLHQYEADFSQPMQLGFQSWLRDQYRTKENLQNAWGNNRLNFEEVSIPTTKERSVTQAGMFRDPLFDKPVVDYYTFQHELIAENIIAFARSVKTNWPRPIITGVFYGYFFSVFNRQAAGGHLALQRILNAPEIDYLSGPQVYYPEAGFEAGEPYRSRSLLHSIRLHGKLWLDEYDQQPRRTWPHLSLFDNRAAYQKIMQENGSLLQRSVAFPLLNGHGLWFYDFGPAGMHLNRKNQYNSQVGTAGYWDDEAYLNTIGQVKRWADELIHEDFESLAEVLVVYDTESIYYLPSTKVKPCPITEHLINWSSLALYYSGCLFDQIHLDDLKQVDLSPYKVVVFMNTFLMDAQERNAIEQRVARQNRHLIWTYAPGYLSPDKAGIEQIEALVKLDLDTFELDTIPEIIINDWLGDSLMLKAKGPYSPTIYIQDTTVTQLGVFRHSAKVGVGYKVFTQFTSWYSSLPITDYRVFRAIFEKAGVTLFTKEKDVVYGGTNWLLYHSAFEGMKTFTWKGKTYQIEFDRAPATKLVHLITNESIFENR